MSLDRVYPRDRLVCGDAEAFVYVRDDYFASVKRVEF